MRKFTCVLAILFLMMAPLTGFAGSEIPDLKGTWGYNVSAVAHQKVTEASPELHTGTKPGFSELVDITLIIDKQEGFLFSGAKVSKDKKEDISGVIGFDNKSIYVVDDDGWSLGRLVSADKMEHIYLHITKHHSIATRGILTRKR